MSKQFMPEWTPHERRVREMMIGFGQGTPDTPTIPDDKTLVARIRQLLEEVFELANAAGVAIEADLPEPCARLHFGQDGGNVIVRRDHEIIPHLELMVDALSDISVVGTGTSVAIGVRLGPMIELTDHNNLMKIANGKLDEHGKFRKSPTHPAPNYKHALAMQGWDAEANRPPFPAMDPAVEEAILGAQGRGKLPTDAQLAPLAANTPASSTQHSAGLGWRPPAGQYRDVNGLFPGEMIYRGPSLDAVLEHVLNNDRAAAVRAIHDTEPDLGPNTGQGVVDPLSLRISDAYVPGSRCVIFKAKELRHDDGTTAPGTAELTTQGLR